MQVTKGKYRIESDSYYVEGRWRARCRITNTLTFHSSPVEPKEARDYHTQAEADAESLRYGRSLAANKVLGF